MPRKEFDLGVSSISKVRLEEIPVYLWPDDLDTTFKDVPKRTLKQRIAWTRVKRMQSDYKNLSLEAQERYGEDEKVLTDPEFPFITSKTGSR